MLDIFQGIFSSAADTVLDVPSFLLCMGVSLAIGIALAGAYIVRNQYTKSFVITLALLPAVVCVVIMMVNGNIGAGVAVAGAFSLVRFRSAAGSAREIIAIFIGMAAGLIAGMGYLGYAGLFTVILGGAMLIYNATGFGNRIGKKQDRTVTVTIPEDLDYNNVFDPIFARYTTKYRLTGVRTTNMGSLFKLTYQITLKDRKDEKRMIDALRVRNGNLEISSHEMEMIRNEAL